MGNDKLDYRAIERFSGNCFTQLNSSKAYGEFLLDICRGKIVAISGWKIIGYGKAPYSNSGCSLALLVEKVEDPELGERVWHHCSMDLFNDTWGFIPSI